MKVSLSRMDQAVKHACAELRTAATVGEDERILDEFEASETRANAEELQEAWVELRVELSLRLGAA